MNEETMNIRRPSPQMAQQAVMDQAKRRRSRFWTLEISDRRILLMLGDVLMLSAGLAAGIWLQIPGSTHYLGWPQYFEWYWWVLLWAMWIPPSVVVGCYDLRLASMSATSIVYAAACTFLVCGVYLVTPLISAPLTTSRVSWLVFATASVSGVSLWRLIYATLFSQPQFIKRLIIVGAGVAGSQMAERLSVLGRGAGIHLVGFVDDDDVLAETHVAGYPVLAKCDRLVDLAQSLHVDEVVVAITNPNAISPTVLTELVRCWEKRIAVTPMALCFEQITGRVPVAHIGGNLLALVERQSRLVLRLWDLVRRIMDLVAGTLGMLLCALVCPFIAVAIWSQDHGPVFYSQRRIGRSGRDIRITKFRTMVQNAESNGAQWAVNEDPRITRVGRFLRRTRLDELPQFWNVLMGSMSLIGPRPERPEFVEQLDDLLPYYAVRHSIKPGLTGWAQVCYHYGSSVDDSERKLEFDLYYVKHRGPVLDVMILLRTVRVVLAMQGT